MTRKDFELIAMTLKASRIASYDKVTLDALARELAERLKATNPQFNRDKFIRACGVCP
jgi:hypothetical protein